MSILAICNEWSTTCQGMVAGYTLVFMGGCHFKVCKLYEHNCRYFYHLTSPVTSRLDGMKNLEDEFCHRTRLLLSHLAKVMLFCDVRVLRMSAKQPSSFFFTKHAQKNGRNWLWLMVETIRWIVSDHFVVFGVSCFFLFLSALSPQITRLTTIRLMRLHHVRFPSKNVWVVQNVPVSAEIVCGDYMILDEAGFIWIGY